MLLVATNMSAIPIWLLGCFLFALLIIGIIKFKKGEIIMQKWKLIFEVTWDDGLPPKRQIFEAREELQFVLQLAQTLDACKTVKLIRMERED